MSTPMKPKIDVISSQYVSLGKQMSTFRPSTIWLKYPAGGANGISFD